MNSFFKLILVSLLIFSQLESAILQMPYVSQETARAIGKQIWQNEGACSHEKLTFWSPLEPFPSFGIGHFIWHPAGQTHVFVQTFPALIAFMEQRNTPIPAWLKQACIQGCPWPSRELFYKESTSQRINELRSLLVATIDLQTYFMIERLYEALPSIIAHASPAQKNMIIEIINILAGNSQGMYALVDYLNFKGSGIDQKERYKNQGWGLLQALEYMATHQQSGTVQAFSAAAERILRQRVANAPEGSPDAQRLQGWLNRLKTYSRPL